MWPNPEVDVSFTFLDGRKYVYAIDYEILRRERDMARNAFRELLFEHERVKSELKQAKTKS